MAPILIKTVFKPSRPTIHQMARRQTPSLEQFFRETIAPTVLISNMLNTGVSDTIIWNSIINGTPVTKSGAAPKVQSNLTWTGATQGALGTIIGHD